jgi:tRNA nucleotidyltransferase/poly(A) polymerase
MQRISSEIIFKKLQEAGAQVFMTGGCVRDELLKLPVKDLDVVVFGLDEIRLKDQLAQFGQVLSYGKSFMIYQIRGFSIEFSLPRESAPASAGSLEEVLKADARGRDFTINALYRHAVAGNLTDPLNGLKDLENKKLRMTSPQAFQVDPLRAYRAVQLVSRLHFELEPETKRAMKAADTAGIPAERIHEELNKWLMAAEPQRGWELMTETGHLPDLLSDRLTGSGSDRIAAINAILAAASRMRDKSKEPVTFMWSVLLAPLIIRNKHHHQQTVDWYKNFSRHHQRTKQLEGLLRATEDFLRKTERKPDVLRLCCMTDPKELELVMEALFPLWESYELQSTIRERLKNFNRWKTDQMVTPVVTGSDLKRLGYQDGPEMGIWLEAAFQMQLEGVLKEDLLSFFQRISHKQTSD